MNLQAREGAPLNRYYDPYFACDAVKLLPGEYFASGEDLVIVTVLGSCVSVCLRDPAQRHRRDEPLHAPRARRSAATRPRRRRATAATPWNC
ncbi:chemoreceptor glutamine deamidase CheD [Pseudomonas aeruginosa]|nr:chemoreceptor glutamine deamidase CheD [Pseudomonas aeruginosa]